MGADLYINKIYQENLEKYEPLFNEAVKKRNAIAENSPAHDVAQKEVTKYYDLMYSKGYFRDSYNGSALFRYLILDNARLSWWKDIVPLQNDNGEIQGEKLMEFLTIILASDFVLPTREQLRENHCQVDDIGPNSLEGWHQYLIEKRERLIDFICLAIESKLSIDASL